MGFLYSSALSFLLVCQLDEHRDCVLVAHSRHKTIICLTREEQSCGHVCLAGSWENHLHGVVPCTVDWMLVMALLWMLFITAPQLHCPGRTLASWLHSLPAFYPSTTSESHKDEVILPSSPVHLLGAFSCCLSPLSCCGMFLHHFEQVLIFPIQAQKNIS